jgi:AcrR family transcriptional regulator
MWGMTPRTRGRQRASHSLEAVLTAAVALLDEAGEPALTLRALAARLGTGVGSIYWYVSGRDELLDRAIDHVLGGVLAAVDARTEGDDPYDELRVLAVALFDAIADRPWMGANFLRNIGVPGNALRLYDRLGQPMLRLDLTPRQRFYAASAVAGVVISNAVDVGQEPPREVVEGTVSREEFLGRYAQTWRELDAVEYPFMHDIVEEFDGHDDKEQFLAALELTLAGLRLQAETQAKGA